MDDLYIRKVLDGQTEEFRYFIKQYKDLAFSVAFSVVKNEFTAAEVVQESFVKAYESLKSFKGESKFSTWLCRIVINESFKTARKEKRTVTENGFVSAKDYHENPLVFDELKESEQKYYINACVPRTARFCYEIDGKTSDILPVGAEELARCVPQYEEMPGWSESNVKVHLHRGRKNMQELLEKMLNTEVKSLY